MEIETIIFIILMVAKYGMTAKNATRNNTIPDVTDSQITTECTTHDLKTEHKEVCQGETLDITCPNGTIIIFHDANFGRLSPKPCKQFLGRYDVSCNTNAETLATLRQRCDQTSRCKVFVSKDVFGSPCFTVTKYLDVKYFCRHKGCKEHTKSIDTYSTSTSHNTYIGNVSSESVRIYSQTVTWEETQTTADDKEKCVIYIFVGSMLMFLTIIIISGYFVTRRLLKRRSRNVLPCPDVARNNVPATTKNEDFTYEEIVELHQGHKTDSYDKDGHLIPVQPRSSKDMDGNSGNHGNRMKLKDEQKDYIKTNIYQPLNHDRHSIPHIYSTTQL